MVHSTQWHKGHFWQHLFKNPQGTGDDPAEHVWMLTVAYTAMWRRKLRQPWMLALLSCHSWLQDSEDFFPTLPFRVSRVKTKSNSSFVFNCSSDTMSPIVCMFYRFLKHFTSQMLFLIKGLWANVVNILLCPSCRMQKMSLVPYTGEQEKPVLSSNMNIHQQHLKEKAETFTFHSYWGFLEMQLIFFVHPTLSTNHN